MYLYICVCVYVFGFFLSRTLTVGAKYNLHSPLLLSRRTLLIYYVSCTQNQFSVHSFPVFLKGSLVEQLHLAVVFKVYTPQS